jgi:membrane protein DedA with SNARE-associated domain
VKAHIGFGPQGERYLVEDLESFLAVMVGTFSSLVAAGVGFPIPEAGPVVFAGGWVGAHPNIGLLGWLLLPVCILGIVIADVILYSIGRLYGPRLLDHRFFSRLVPANKRERIEHNFHKYGMKILLFARLLPSIPSLVSITAGTMRVPLRRFVIADIVYAIPGIGLLFTLAFWFGTQLQQLVENADKKVHEARPYLIIAGILLIGGYLLYHFLRRPVATGDPKDIPIIGDQMAAKIESVEKVLSELSGINTSAESSDNGKAAAPANSPHDQVATSQKPNSDDR